MIWLVFNEKNFLPQKKAISYRLTGYLLAGTSLEKANEMAVKIEDVLIEERPNDWERGTSTICD
jgi:hypothetical protein